MSEHVIRRTLSPTTWGTQVTLTCSCGRWSAMTVAYGPYTVRRCTNSLLTDRDGVHVAAALAN